MAGWRPPLPLPLLLLAPAAAVAAAGQQLPVPDVVGDQLSCLASYLQHQGRRTVEVYIDRDVNGNFSPPPLPDWQ